jgi:hypothetical protein
MPPTRSHRASSAPVAPPNNGHGQNDRPHVGAGEVCVGCIVWLPHKVPSASGIKCNKANCCGNELEDGGYEHPVVVLSVKQKAGSHVVGDLICTVACVSTVRLSELLLISDRSQHLQILHFQST